MMIKSGNDIVKVNSKTNLNKLLKTYKGIITPEIYDYLSGLVGLDYSVFGSQVSDQVKSKLIELDLFRQIAVYNIYNQTKNFLSEEGKNLIISGNEREIEGLQARINFEGEEVPVLDYEYQSVRSNNDCDSITIPSSRGIVTVGTVDLFLTEIDEDKRKEAIEKAKLSLEAEIKKSCPYPSTKLEKISPKANRYDKVVKKPRCGGNTIDLYAEVPVYGQAGRWIHEHKSKVANLKKRIKAMEEKIITDSDMKIIEQRKYYYDLLLQLYELEPSQFEEPQESRFTLSSSEPMAKTLVKKAPGMQVRTNIRKI